VAGFPVALSLAPEIASDIMSTRDAFEHAASSAPKITDGVANRTSVEILYGPFIKPLHGKKNWQVWATKFWHFLNPDAFPIEDSRVDRFFKLAAKSHSADKYMELLRRFAEFRREYDVWLPKLRVADEGQAWSDNKLWDKVCYGVEELLSDTAT